MKPNFSVMDHVSTKIESYAPTRSLRALNRHLQSMFEIHKAPLSLQFI